MMDTEETLSEREIEILRLVATGVSNKEIATALSISPNTVKVHMRNIFTKIGVFSRTEATLYAIKNGIVAQPGQSEVDFASLNPYMSPDVNNPLALTPGLLNEQETPKRFNLRTVLLWMVIVGVVIIGTIYLSNSVIGQANPTATLSTAATSPSPRWQENRSLPGPRAGMGGVVYNNRFYLVGGETRTGVSGDLLVFSLERQEWSALAIKTTAVSGVQAAVIGEKIYVPGGKKKDGSTSNILEVYDPRQNSWETRAAMPSGLSNYAMTAYEGAIFLFGGMNGKDLSNKIYRYDPDQDVWETRELVPGARADSTAAALDGRILLLGGRSKESSLAEVWIYYPDRGGPGEIAWEKGVDLPEARYGLAVAVMANSVFLVGGQSSPSDIGIHSPLVLAPNATTWQALGLPATIVGSRNVLLASGNFLHILGGETSEGLMNEHLVYQALYTVSIPLISNEGGITPEP